MFSRFHPGLALLLALALLGSAHAQENAPEPNAPTPNAPAPHGLTFPGKLYNSSVVPVITPFPGIVVERLCDVGTPVHKNDPLIEIELDPQKRLALKRQLSVGVQVKQAELTIAQQKLALKDLKEKKAMLESLVEKGMAPARELEATSEQIVIAQKSLAASKRALSQLWTENTDQFELLSEQFGQPIRSADLPATFVVRSPSDGIVLQVQPETEPGLYVQGQLFLVGRTDPMIIRALAYESDMIQLQVGSMAQVEVEALGNKVLEARLERVSLTPTDTNLAAPSYYTLELSVDNPDGTLREGYKVKVNFP